MPSLRRALTRWLWGKGCHLISLEDPWKRLPALLDGQKVSTIVDAGASDGRITRRLLSAFPRATAYLFEPNPEYAEALRAYAAADNRVRPQFLALADKQGELEFFQTASRGSCSLLKPSAELSEGFPQDAAVRGVRRVRAVRLDDWVHEAGLAGIDVMKFDIQGGELAAFRGGREVLSASTQAVYTEVWFRRMYEGGAVFAETDAFLRDLGFVLVNLYKPKTDARGFLLWANALYVHPGRVGV